MLGAGAIGLLSATYSHAQAVLPNRVQLSAPVHVAGESMTYDSRLNRFVVVGHSSLRQGPRLLTAHEIDFEPKRQRARATGQVHLSDPEADVYASCATLDLTNETGELDDALIRSRNQTFKLQGKQVHKGEGQRYLIRGGSFTACQCGEGPPAWSISAQEMDVDVPGTATARGTQFEVLGHPILPVSLPKVWFPVGVDRASGLLSPQPTISNFRGFQVVQPYFLDISRSSDATVALDMETSQRVGVYGEYRLDNGPDDYFWVDGGYFNEFWRSNANRASSIFDSQLADTNIPVNRADLIGMLRQHIGDNLTVYADSLNVSDTLLLRDLDMWTLSNDYNYSAGINLLRYTTSDVGLLDDFTNGYAQVRSVWFQDLIQAQQFDLQKPLDGLVSGRTALPGGFAYSDYDAQLTDFWREEGLGGGRLNLQPSASVPFRWQKYLYGSASVGMYDTFYDVSGHQVGITPVDTGGRLFNNGLYLGPLAQGGLLAREPVPYFNFQLSTIVGRVFNPNWNSLEKLRQTVEPFVYYAYVPNIYQGNLPIFDEVDRVEGRSLITYGFSTRFLAKFPSINSQPPPLSTTETSRSQGPLLTAFSPGRLLGVGGIEDLLDLTVMQSYDTSHAVAVSGSHLSDLELDASFLPTRLGWFSGNVDYDVAGPHTLDAANLAFNFQPPWEPNVSPVYMGRSVVGSFFTLSYSYLNPSALVFAPPNAARVSYLTFQTYYELFKRAGLFFGPSYDLATHKFLATNYGLRLKSPCNCWAADFGLMQTIAPVQTAFTFQITLGGLGSVGTNPFGSNPFQLSPFGAVRSTGFLTGYR